MLAQWQPISRPYARIQAAGEWWSKASVGIVAPTSAGGAFGSGQLLLVGVGR